MRYNIKRSTTRPNGWVVTDTANSVVVEFEQHKFNDTQKVTFLNDPTIEQMNNAHVIMKDIAEWISSNHYFIAMPIDDNSCRSYISRLIKDNRTALGWSVYELSKRSGVQAISIHNIENGKFDVKGETLIRLATAMGKRLILD